MRCPSIPLLTTIYKPNFFILPTSLQNTCIAHRASRSIFLLLVLIGVLSGCKNKQKSELIWNKDLALIGSQSSPRTADLNNDGVLDIVMGAGQNEFQKSAQGIIAFDGKTGDILWQQEGLDQVYGSATFYDINADKTPDIFIGGRSPHFKAMDGKTGSILWEYKFAYESDPIMQYARFNFNNSVLVPDQNSDGLMDLLTVNGGNANAQPNTTADRYPGVLMVLDSKNGNIIAADTMPDGNESYMSPLCFQQPGQSDYTIVFGTGGETISGHLYSGTLKQLMRKDLKSAAVIASETGHGFIAPPSAADINKDGYLDIVAISHGSSVFAIDGRSAKQLWRQHIEGTESSNSLAVGHFNNDDIPDFFTFVSKGQWPNSTGSVQIMLDGTDGHVAFTDSIGCTGYSSAVVYDLNNDGVDEAIISVNEFDCSFGFTGKSPATVENKLIAIDFVKHDIISLDQSMGFKNIFSTPWIGDLDDDGYLDIVHCQYYHVSDLLFFLGMKIKRIDTPIKIRKPVAWGAYMGSRGNGCFVDAPN